MISEGTVKPTSNIALAALFRSFTSLSSMTEVQLPQITQQQTNWEECKHCKTVLKREKYFNSSQ